MALKRIVLPWSFLPSLSLMPSATKGAAPIALELDIDYVDAKQDACFAWLKEKYAHLHPVAVAAATAAPLSSPDDEEDSTETTGKTRAKKPRLDKAVLQRVENDFAACDALRWRVFAFPSHPTRPLSSSYRNEPGNKNGPSALTAELHKVKKSAGNDAAVASVEPSDSADAGQSSRYALVIRTRANAEAKKREKKQKKKARLAASTTVATTISSSPARMEELMEKIVREEEEARWSRILGEESVKSDVSCHTLSAAGETSTIEHATWTSRWSPRSWRPLLGGYVSAPNRADSARFLLFPQSAHPPVDFRDPTTPQLPPGASLSGLQSVNRYVRGSVNWDVEKHNPAAGVKESRKESTSASPVQDSPALSYSIHAAQTLSAPTDPRAHNWADTVAVSVAVQQSRTERKYTPEREKVQRVTLLEDSAAVKISQGDPRSSITVTATHATVANSGVRHQHEAPPDSSSSAIRKRKQSASPLTYAKDDSIDQLQVLDEYDSSVQHFALPPFWQRLVRPSLKPPATTDAGESGIGTDVLDAVPRGQYRVRWSGGPGIEVCRVGDGPAQQRGTSPMPWYTIFGKLWTESWLEMPLPWRLALKLRTQSAVTMPLEPSDPVWPSMVADAPPPVIANGERHSDDSRLREHPYFWATQGPRWDAALVRGFKNDYSGMHHARRWYSILSAELTLNGSGEKGNGKQAASRKKVSGDATSTSDAGMTPRPAPPSSRWANTSLTAFANACMVDTLRDYPRASVGFSFTSKIPRLAITPFNEVIPHKFECSFSWFAAFKATRSEHEGEPQGPGGRGFGVEFVSGMQQQQSQQQGEAATTPADGVPFLRVSPVETFHHMKCGLTWKFDE